MLGFRATGMLECWTFGMLQCWNNAYWNIGTWGNIPTYIPPSRHCSIPKPHCSKHLNMPTSQHPDIATSQHGNILTSQHPILPIFQRPSITTPQDHSISVTLTLQLLVSQHPMLSPPNIPRFPHCNLPSLYLPLSNHPSIPTSQYCTTLLVYRQVCPRTDTMPDRTFF